MADLDDLAPTAEGAPPQPNPCQPALFLFAVCVCLSDTCAGSGVLACVLLVALWMCEAADEPSPEPSPDPPPPSPERETGKQNIRLEMPPCVSLSFWRSYHSGCACLFE